MPLKLYIGATFKGKNMLPKGSIFFPLIVASFKNGFLYVEIHSTVSQFSLQYNV